MRVVTIASGKGGVGKSTLSLNLALALAERGHRVGLLDADLYGPDIPLMIGLTRQERLRSWDLWRSSGPVRLEPVERFGIRVMSAGFLLGEDQALAFAASLVQVVLHQLLTGVAWGELDELVMDLPPGTADLQQQLLGLVRPAGAVIVVGPQAVADAGDTGRPLLLAHPASRPAQALREIASRLTAALDADAGD
jgi:ATP-binding protein involved in chromosome partitioning